MRIVLAPDKFKGSLSADEVVEAMSRAIAVVDDSIEVLSRPMADGGDGTLAAVLAAGFTPVRVPTVDALGRPTLGTVARSGDAAFIELAESCGLAGVADLPLQPMNASTRGLGLLAREALAMGARQIMVGLGGSASVDGGLGFLQGLGFAITDVDGVPVSGDASGLLAAHRVDAGTAPESARGCEWVFLVDVDAPLCGATGAASVFGPQKGLDPSGVEQVDSGLVRWARLLGAEESARIPGTGAAGGVAFAALATMGARIESGASYVASLIGLEECLARADLVITGEGSFDGQSWATDGYGESTALVGKAPGVVIAMAARRGIPVCVVAGVVDVQPDDLHRHGVSAAASLVQMAGSSERAMREPAHWLAAATRALLADLDVGATSAGNKAR